LFIVGLPLAGKWARRTLEARCGFDGLRIEPLYRVRIVERTGESHDFCSVRCGLLWLARQPTAPAAVYVTDEASGTEVDGRMAHFVRSTVVTHPVTRNRIHAFRELGAAEEHARAYRGQVLTGEDHPFGQATGSAAGAPPSDR
jgi:hypothetical protein